MIEEKKILRLGKAAREFNVATSTIVAVLNNKHIDIEDSPNTKLTREMYEILLKEFHSDKADKENAEKIDLGYTYPKTADVEAPVSEVVIEEQKTTPPVEPEPQKKPEVVEVFKTTAQTPKVVGVIELPSKKTRGKKAEVKDAEPESDKKTTTDVIEAVEKEEEIIEEVKTEDTVKKAKTKEKEAKEHIKTAVKPLQGPKIVDYIDLESVGKKRKKTEKITEEEIEEATVPLDEQAIEKEEHEAEVLDKAVEEKPQEEKVEHIETEYEKLKGIKVVGIIDLKTEKEKEPKQKAGDDEKEKTTAASTKPKERKRKRIKVPKPASHTPKSSDLSKGGAKEADKTEISSEELDRQIKETMQRMGTLGKSKTSKYKREKRKLIQAEILEHEKQEQEEEKILKVAEFITANELATMMNISVNQIISTCMSIGLFVSINQRLDAETIALLAEEFGFQVSFVGIDVEDEHTLAEEDDPKDLQPRHPIIAVMGHVDHGKTSLLDYIRKTNVIAGEAGGITQHIGAYEVQLPSGRKITFLDTPGHEAFTAMRARGAKVTDLCIIVIAADDDVMPQTVEAINHAQAAGVPMVFAITKIDKPHANPEKIKEGLAKMNILVEDWGGKYQCQEINAKLGTNVNELLEKVLIEAEFLELKANPNRSGVGTVIESSLDKGKGYVAKILVQNGTLRHGDPILAGSCYGKVKALYNERNQLVKEVLPSSPVLMLGLNGAPQAGDIFRVCATEQEARIAANKRMQVIREIGIRTQKHITLEEIGRRLAIGDFKELNLIVKGDADGSVEALTDELLKLSTEQVQVNVIHKSVGQVTDTDVMLASASNAIIVAFQVRPSPSSRKLAEQEQIDIRIYSIIYTAINEIKDAIAGMHTPEIHEKILCNLEVRETFKISKVGTIAGCLVLDGKLQKNNKVRVIREGIVIYTGKLGSLKRFKDDVKEVVAGQECGLNIEKFNDIKVGDIIEGFEEYEVKVTL